MRSLNLDQLRTFMTVTTVGSFSAAARRLNLTQPAVSQQIKELEARLGVRLLDRLGKKAFVTAAGEDLRGHARQLMEQADAAIDAMRRHRDGWLGRVRLGTDATLCAYLLPPLLLDVRRRYPTLDIRIEVGPSGRLAGRVSANEIDLGLVTAPIPGDLKLRVELAIEDTFVAFWPATLGPAPDVVTPQSLAGKPFISFTKGNVSYDLVQQWFETANVRPGATTELDIGTNMIALAGAGIGATILPPEVTIEALRFEAVSVRAIDPPIARQVMIVTRRDKPMDRALEIMREALLALSPQPRQDAAIGHSPS
jgi:DNA-binding transcriptional LysR family regulator